MSHVTTIPESYNVYDMTLASPPVGELLWSRPLDPSANHDRPGIFFLQCEYKSGSVCILYIGFSDELPLVATHCNPL